MKSAVLLLELACGLTLCGSSPVHPELLAAESRHIRPLSDKTARAQEVSIPAFSSQKPGAKLRVCADPNNLPFSNQRGEGFENKLAQLMSRDLAKRVVYTWWSERKGFVAHTLEAGRCDIVLGLPTGFPGVLTTTSYYRSTYVFVYRAARQTNIRSLDDPQLRSLRIGVHVVGDDYAPPAQMLGRRGIVNNIVGYSLFGPYGQPNPPARIIDAVAQEKIDVAIVWGPLAGYFAKRAPVPLKIVPVLPRADGPAPVVYGISFAVRRGEPVLESKLERFLKRRQLEIHRILSTYGVPQV